MVGTLQGYTFLLIASHLQRLGFLGTMTQGDVRPPLATKLFPGLHLLRAYSAWFGCMRELVDSGGIFTISENCYRLLRLTARR